MQLCHHVVCQLFQIDRIYQILIAQIDRHGSSALSCIISIDCFRIHIKYNGTVILLHGAAIAKTQHIAIVFVKSTVASNQLWIDIANTPSRIQFQHTTQNSILWLNRIPEIICSLFQIELFLFKKLFDGIAGDMFHLRYAVTRCRRSLQDINTKLFCKQHFIAGQQVIYWIDLAIRVTRHIKFHATYIRIVQLKVKIICPWDNTQFLASQSLQPQSGLLNLAGFQF